jgi:TonB family protein
MKSLVAIVATFASLAIASLVGAEGGQSPDVERELSRLVVEKAGEPATNIEDGILRVRRNGGWARSRRIVSDFVLSGQFRLLAPDAELQIGIRTINTVDEWPRRGYRVRLSSRSPVTFAANGYPLKQTIVNPVHVTAADWHSFSIKANGRRVELSINGQSVGTCEIEILAGAILFQTTAGDAELKALDLQALWPTGLIRAEDYRRRSEFINPRLRREVKPNYSANTMAANVQGVVTLEAVVLEDGSVGPIRLTSLLHVELEHAALLAIRQWKFDPARLNGSRVPTVIGIEMSFSLGGRSGR